MALASLIVLSLPFLKIDLVNLLPPLVCVLPPTYLNGPEVKEVKVYRVIVQRQKLLNNLDSSRNSLAKKTIKPAYKANNLALYNLSNIENYLKKLSLTRLEFKTLMNQIIVDHGAPCQRFQLKGSLLKKCRATTFEEAAHYAINAKLLPCAKKGFLGVDGLLNCYFL
jgi:hypothetical protein